MGEFLSVKSRLAFAREASLGTRPEAFGGSPSSGSASARFIGITNQGLELPDKEVEIREYPSFGAGQRLFTTKPGRRTRKGSIPFIPTTGELFYYIFGAEAFTGGSPNVHVLTPGTGPSMPSFALGAALEGSPNFLRYFVGCVVDGATINLNEGGEVNVAMDIFAKDVLDEEVSSPTLFTQPAGTSQVPYMFYDRSADVSVGGTYDFSANTYSGGRTLARVKSLSMGVRHGVVAHYPSQSSSPQNPYAFTKKRSTFDFSMDLMPAGKLSGDTDAIYDLLEGETAFDVLVPFQRSSSDRIDFVFDNCRIASAPHNFPEDGGEVVVPVRFVPEEFRVVVRDSIASYPTL